MDDETNRFTSVRMEDFILMFPRKAEGKKISNTDIFLGGGKKIKKCSFTESTVCAGKDFKENS